MAANEGDENQPWFLKSNFPVLFPAHQALTLPQDQFEAFLQSSLGDSKVDNRDVSTSDAPASVEASESFTAVDTPPSTTVEIRSDMDKMDVQEPAKPSAENEHPFMAGLKATREPEPSTSMENKMLTKKGDIAYRSTTNPLVDLFHELEDAISGPRLRELLFQAWAFDKLATLKIIFNARSIHLGKSSKPTFYRAAGWLAQSHPLTLVSNLRWLSRPVIEKKVETKEGSNDDMVIVEEKDVDENNPAHYDVRNGVAHGYWKDLLNILALAVNGKFGPLHDPRDVLNVDERKNKSVSKMSKETAKATRSARQTDRNSAATRAFDEDPTYRALHLAVARLFAEQLQSDLAALRGADNKARRNISLCSKWAPSPALFHDKHTFIVSSIAEIMHPTDGFAVADDREKYLRHAREAYRKDIAALRKHLEVVERNLTANTLGDVKYNRVPSLAMSNYAPIFATKDSERFDEYITAVAGGKARISGATLLPSTLIRAVRVGCGWNTIVKKDVRTKKLVDAKMAEIQDKVADGQWKTLVQRIKDSGRLENSIAVCDVSGSMRSPVFPDGTCPMDSSIGLSLLLAEVTSPPFGGAFITFSTNPELQTFDVNTTLREKYSVLEQSVWGMNTDFGAVFERLILPMAQKTKLKPEDMVKRIFVFSDMQFDPACGSCLYDRDWKTSYQRISQKFEQAGYQMPELVFWNLAGGRAGYLGGSTSGDPIAPKPVTTEYGGTALVSGYSQGMLKVFLANGSFEEPEEEEAEEIEVKDEEGDVAVVEKTIKKQKLDPLAVVMKAIGHKAYDMLRVRD